MLRYIFANEFTGEWKMRDDEESQEKQVVLNIIWRRVIQNLTLGIFGRYGFLSILLLLMTLMINNTRSKHLLLDVRKGLFSSLGYIDEGKEVRVML